MCMVIPAEPSSSVRRLERRDGETWFEAAAREVGGVCSAWLEPVRLGDCVLLVDEDGHSNQRPTNHRASILAGQRLVGTVVMVPASLEGEVLG